MYQLKKIDIGTVALYSFLMFLILGLLILIPFGLFFSIMSSLLPERGGIQSEAFPFFGGIFIILIPIFYAVFGTIMNVLIVLFYNLLSLKLGGIKFNLEKIEELGQIVEESKSQ